MCRSVFCNTFVFGSIFTTRWPLSFCTGVMKLSLIIPFPLMRVLSHRLLRLGLQLMRLKPPVLITVLSHLIRTARKGHCILLPLSLQQMPNITWHWRRRQRKRKQWMQRRLWKYVFVDVILFCLNMSSSLCSFFCCGSFVSKIIHIDPLIYWLFNILIHYRLYCLS